MKDQPVGTEAYGLYNAEMKFVGSKVGKPGDREIYIPDLDYPYIAVHNHPDGMTFSESDVFNFIRYPNLQVQTAVGNSGHVYLLEKSIDFAIADFLKAFQKIRSDYPHMMDSPKDYEDAMKSFLKRGVDYGINYFEGRP